MVLGKRDNRGKRMDGVRKAEIDPIEILGNNSLDVCLLTDGCVSLANDVLRDNLLRDEDVMHLAEPAHQEQAHVGEGAEESVLSY